jgi:hypothetical protein
MDASSQNCLVEHARSVNGRTDDGLRALAEPAGALYVGSTRTFGFAGVTKMSRI